MADYSINAVTRRVVYSGSAGLGPYAFSFEILEQTDITVYFNATKLTLTTDYTVSINANGTGSVTLIVATNVPQTPVNDDQIVVVGARDLERVTDFVTAGDLRASALNEQLDSLVIFDQQVAEEAKRTMRAPVYDPALVEDGGSLNMELPTASSRAGKTLAFDDNGNPIVGEDIGNWRGDWAAGTAYTVRDIVRDASNYNIYRVNTSHTSSGTTPISSNADVAKWDLVIDASYAATQATNAAASATAAAASATAAATSETNASTSETNAASSASTATTKASEAATSATNAATSETNAGTSETNAATSATNASNSASAASTSASAASTSATAAASSATAAAASETAAGTSETNAATSATNAATSATNAGTSETNAASSATAAATSATNAATSATNAATSATAASSSATAAANSAAAAAAAFDNFDDTYLGSFTADPTVDNDGDALVEGALYFNTTANEMRVYDGANWIAASSAGTASLLEYKYTATAGQTTFSGTDDNSATLSYSTANLIVTLNGIVLENGTDYTATSGTSIVLTVGASAGDELNVIAFKSFTTADMVSATTGGTFNGNVAVNGDLTVDTDTLHVDSTNNRVGIGTSSPVYTMHTHNAGNTFVYNKFTNSSTGTGSGDGLDVGISGVNALIYNNESGNIQFATSGSERMRIHSNGHVAIGSTADEGILYVASSENTNIEEHRSSNSSYTSQMLRQRCNRGGSSGYYFLLASSGNTADNEAWIRGDGKIAGDGGFQTGADYAEYFEWDDGNSSNEDRRGYSVVLTNGNKIRKATSSDTAADIIGVISAHPTVIGDAAWASWSGKFNRDDFGGYIWETYTVTEWTEADGTEHSYHTDQIPSDVTAPADATIITEDDDGNTLKRKQVNSSYDDTQTYTPREERQEWDAVGMVGKLRLRAGQPTGDRWIKMRDIATDDDGNVTIEEWLVR